MSKVYILLDSEKNIIAVYDDKNLVENMKKPIEEKLNTTLTIEERSVNLDLALLGIFK